MNRYPSDSYNAGGKLILVARIIRWGGIAACAALAIILLTDADSGGEIATALLIPALSYPACWVTALFIHGFGVIVARYERAPGSPARDSDPYDFKFSHNPQQADVVPGQVWWQCSCGAINDDILTPCRECRARATDRNPHGWLCVCGARNVTKRRTCGKCGRPSPTLADNRDAY